MNKQTIDPAEISKLLYRYDKVATKYDSLQQIEEKEVQLYRQQGYLAVEKVLTNKEIEDAIHALMEMVYGDTKGAKVQFTKPSEELKTMEERELAVRKIERYVECDERLKAIAYHPQILDAVEKLIGEKPVLAQDQALLKPPHGGGEKPWHQDMAYGNLAYNKQVIGVWIALDEASVDNGCMHVIPGTHAEGAIPHYSVRDWQICDNQIEVERDVIVPLQPGGLMFFHGMVKHGTPSNFSHKRRRALQFHYVGESAVKLNPQEYKRFFTNEMTGAEC